MRQEHGEVDVISYNRAISAWAKGGAMAACFDVGVAHGVAHVGCHCDQL